MSLPSSESNSNPSEILFRSLSLGEPILNAIEKAGYTTATPIQARAIPPLLEGRDVVGQAQTGTGKTAAFAIPLLQRIDPDQKVPQVLVLTPTRELAMQVADSFRRYAAGMPGLRIAAIYGGQDYQVQFRQLDRGVHVVVGTPGRVIDHINRSSLKLDGLRAIVLDEADEMLRMGFAEDVELVLNRAPEERQIALFSATMPDPIRKIAQRHLRNPVEVTIKQAATPTSVRQRFMVVAPHQKQDAVARVLEAEDIDGVLIFVNTKSTTDPLAEYLSARGHRTAALSGDVAQAQRERIVEHLRTGKVDVIIATDVAARGLDVQRISHVINYDLPFDTESYVHRIGRTGRASRTGDAILLVQPRGRHLLRRIEQATRQSIEPMEIPSARVINERRTARFHGKITAALGSPNLEAFVSLVEQYRGQSDAPVERIAAALASMAAGEAPLFLEDEIEPIHFAEPRGRDGRNGARSPSDRRPFEPERRGGPLSRGARGFAPGGSGRMETFRIEVGRDHQIKPANIVGAIANETGVESSCIGRIQIFDQFSTVDMLVGMPRDMFETLKGVKVAGRRLNISRFDGAPSDDDWPAVAPSPTAEGRGESARADDADDQPVSAEGAEESRPNAKAAAKRHATRKPFGPKSRDGRAATSSLKSKGKFSGLRPGKKLKGKAAKPKRIGAK